MAATLLQHRLLLRICCKKNKNPEEEDPNQPTSNQISQAEIAEGRLEKAR